MTRSSEPIASPNSQREKALLVGIDLTGRPPRPDPAGLGDDAEARLEELEVLATSAGARIGGRVQQARPAPDAATLIGSGKLQELTALAESESADVVIFDRDLTPTQLRNLEKALPCKVVDRTQLILDIFASRARTREGKLQVELAQLNYLLPRLTGRGAAMSRLGGGIGTRGPGETKLETDRRRIHIRIQKLGQQLESVRTHRGVQRMQRQAVPLATVALAGYTNAGKSTLFNRLTGAGVLADAKMFATLDPTVRQFTLPSRRRVLLSDTVGFIRNLPTTLVKAFRATLEEAAEAAIILHLVDAASPHAPALIAHVQTVLGEIGSQATPQILVLTKTDLLPENTDTAQLAARMLMDAGLEPDSVAATVAVSAHDSAGLDVLSEAIDALLKVDPVRRVHLRVPGAKGNVRHLLHQYGRVIHEDWQDDVCFVEADVPESLYAIVGEFATGLVH
ncbi:MAG: GTPase HflX [Bryobacteraceae bacterium]